jgi:hypothetical protein
MGMIDKIPLELMTESPGDETFKLGTVTISKGEYANSEKINQIIDEHGKTIDRHEVALERMAETIAFLRQKILILEAR